MTVSSPNHTEIIHLAEELVRKHMSQYDPSHDWWHVNRVRNTALKLAKALKEDVGEEKHGEVDQLDMLVAELTALFHDMADAKYASTSSLAETLSPFFTHPLITSSTTLSPAQCSSILRIIPLISWSTEKKLRASGEWESHERALRKEGGWEELCCVQDADRLDAIGGFGIMRCAAYSACVNRALHVPPRRLDEPVSPEQDEEINNTAIGHFYDKLLMIKERMKTPAGKREAEKRHQTMEVFLEAIKEESSWD